MSYAKSDEGVRFKDGKTFLKVGGVEHVLRRPTIGETVEFAELADGIEVPDDDKRSVAERTRESASTMYRWWQLVVERLDENGGQLPDFEDCPLWLVGTARLVTEVQIGWMELPLDGPAPSTLIAGRAASSGSRTA